MTQMKFQYMLAPMEKVVDASFRTICHKYGADITFTELVRFEGLKPKSSNYAIHPFCIIYILQR